MSIRRFRVTPSQFQVFRFTLERTTVVRIELIATEPVGLIILDSDGLFEYEHGSLSTYEVAESLPPRSYARASIRLTAGTWYLIVEGFKKASEGRVHMSP
jgi:hypothetical protein